jgi:hypothetical protein
MRVATPGIRTTLSPSDGFRRWGIGFLACGRPLAPRSSDRPCREIESKFAIRDINFPSIAL